MKNSTLLFVILLGFATTAFGQNAIYLDQISTSGTTTITQSGGTNRIGSSGTPSTITGDSGTFDIKQIGNGNHIDFALTGDTFQFKLWNTGDANVQKLYLTGANNQFSTVNTGNSNTMTFNSDGTSSGTTAATTGNGTFNFNVTGNSNSFLIGVAGGAYNNLDYTVQGNSNIFLAKQSGTVAGADGHSQVVTVSGSSNNVSITQSGTEKQTAVMNLTGSSNTVTVTQGPGGP